MPEARPASPTGRAADLDLLKTLLVWGMITAHCIQLLAFRPRPPALVISDVTNLITFSGFMFAFGLGVGLSPWIYAANDIADGRLVAPYGFTPTPAKFHLVIPDAPPKRGLAAFRAWLLEEAAKAPPPPMAAVG